MHAIRSLVRPARLNLSSIACSVATASILFSCREGEAKDRHICTLNVDDFTALSMQGRRPGSPPTPSASFDVSSRSLIAQRALLRRRSHIQQHQTAQAGSDVRVHDRWEDVHRPGMPRPDCHKCKWLQAEQGADPRTHPPHQEVQPGSACKTMYPTSLLTHFDRFRLRTMVA